MKRIRLFTSVFIVFLTSVLTVVSADTPRTATGIPTVVNGFVVSITVTDGGFGYTNPPTVTISGGGGSGATAEATLLNGSVNQIIVENAGHGYTNSPTVVISGPPIGELPFSDGLIAYYPLTVNANDESGNKNDLASFDVTYSSDPKNPGALFNGSSSRLVANHPFILGRANWTLSYWLKPLSLGSNDQVMIYVETPEAYLPKFAVYLDNKTGRILVNIFNSALPGEWKVSYFYSTNLYERWTQMAFTLKNGALNQGELCCYINGILLASDHSSAASADPTLKTFIGYPAAPDYGAGRVYAYKGYFRNFRIYDQPLSSSDIMGLYRYEANDMSELQVEVKSVRVNMYVKQGSNYQLESTSNFTDWTKMGSVFTATEYLMYRDYDVIGTNRYFRIYEVRP